MTCCSKGVHNGVCLPPVSGCNMHTFIESPGALTFLMPRHSFSGRLGTIPWLLIPWRHLSYWLCSSHSRTLVIVFNWALVWGHITTMVSQITSLSIVCPTGYQGDIKSLHYWRFVRGIQWWLVDSSYITPVKEKAFPYHDVILEWSQRPAPYSHREMTDNTTLHFILFPTIQQANSQIAPGAGVTNAKKLLAKSF